MLIRLLADNPLLLLFIVSGAGYLAGRVSLGGVRLGVSAVLFVGLMVSALDPAIRLPELVPAFGLTLFVYAIGLACGPNFFMTLRRSGLRDNSLVLGALLFAATLTGVLRHLLQLKPTLMAGVFAGSLNSTPALAAVLEQLKTAAAGSALETMSAEAVVACSLTYPIGVAGVILALLLGRAWLTPKLSAEQTPHNELLIDRTIQVNTTGRLSGLSVQHELNVLFVRHKRDGHQALATEDLALQPGDLISVLGTGRDVIKACAALGQHSEEELALDHLDYDYRRIFVSDSKLEGKRLSELDALRGFGAVVTRVRRGDLDLLATGRTRLRLGDRVRVVAPRAALPDVSAFFGDSYKEVSEIDVTTFSLGLALGLILGLITIPLPGGHAFRLGLAGGPLVAGLLLGAKGRTGPFSWSLPYSANLTLRQLGLTLFLAGVGINSGYAFLSTLRHGGGLALLGAGALITFTTALLALLVGSRLFGIPYGLLSGIVAALYTQPAALALAQDQTQDDLPEIGYSAVYPAATLAKIILAQLLLQS